MEHGSRKSGEINRVIESGADYARRIIEEGLKRVGLKEGDVVLVHSDASPAMYLGDFEWWVDACELIKSCFLDLLGNSGTLIVPTINWDFCKGNPYFHERTPSQVGMFSNNVLFDERSIRSLHPIYSFSAIGPSSTELFSGISKSAFGENSVFHRLHNINAKIIFFNSLVSGFTFAHYVEQCRGVSYRFIKEFTGELNVGGNKYIDTFDFNVRYLDLSVEEYWVRLRDDLFAARKMHRVDLNAKYPKLLAKCDDIYNIASKGLKTQPYYLLKHAPYLLNRREE